MSARGPRTTIAPGIYSDDIGHEARARAKGRTTSKRFTKSATLATMKAWQDDERRKLRAAARAQQSDLPPGTLGGDVVTHLATLPADQRRHTGADYAAWLTAELKSKPRRTVTLEQLRTLVSTWIDAGVAANTINHRVRALRKLYEALDGTDPPVLPRRLARQREPAPAPRAADMALLTAILASMPDFPTPTNRSAPSKAKARLLFLLWGSMAPSTLMRMGPHSVDLEQQLVHLPARLKGRGAPAVTLPLVDPEGVEAARAWLRAHAWGTFDRHRLSARFRAAVKRYAAAHPDVSISPGLRMYDLRHSFLTWLAWKTVTPETPAGNPYVVQQYAQHKDLKTTQRYMLAIIPHMVRQVLGVPRSVPRK